MTGVYSDYGSLKITLSDGSVGGLYASDGSIRATVVSGLSPVGRYAADGSINIVVVDASALTPWGIYDPCGALRVIEVGSSFGIMAGNGAIYVDGAIFTFAPVLEWTGDTADLSPNFTAVFDFRAAAGDEVTLEFASDIDFTTDVATYVHNITAGEISGDQLSIAVTDLDYGQWYARIKHKLSGSSYSDWSEPVSILLIENLTDVILMEDGVSKFLMEDGVSYYLLES